MSACRRTFPGLASATTAAPDLFWVLCSSAFPAVNATTATGSLLNVPLAANSWGTLASSVDARLRSPQNEEFASAVRRHPFPNATIHCVVSASMFAPTLILPESLVSVGLGVQARARSRGLLMTGFTGWHPKSRQGPDGPTSGVFGLTNNP